MRAPCAIPARAAAGKSRPAAGCRRGDPADGPATVEPRQQDGHAALAEYPLQHFRHHQAVVRPGTGAGHVAAHQVVQKQGQRHVGAPVGGGNGVDGQAPAAQVKAVRLAAPATGGGELIDALRFAAQAQSAAAGAARHVQRQIIGRQWLDVRFDVLGYQGFGGGVENADGVVETVDEVVDRPREQIEKLGHPNGARIRPDLVVQQETAQTVIQVAVHAGRVRQEDGPQRLQALPDAGARHLFAAGDGLADVDLELGERVQYGRGINGDEAQFAHVVGGTAKARRNGFVEHRPQHSQHERVAAGQVGVDPQEKGNAGRPLFKIAQQRHALQHRGRAVGVDLLQRVHRLALRRQ